MCDYQGHEFGARYPDSVCIDGYLWDADSGDACGDGWCYTLGGEIPCPNCNAEAHADYYGALFTEPTNAEGNSAGACARPVSEANES